jgi:hypothetical protein
MALMSPGTASELKMRNFLHGRWNVKRQASIDFGVCWHDRKKA